MAGWIGVDLDGTLAHYGDWKGPGHIGEPIAPMVDRVKRWLAAGREVRIFTARVWAPADNADLCKAAAEAAEYIAQWCEKHIGVRLPVTCQKDYGMVELWDDRCVQVIANLGIPVTQACCRN